MPSTSRQGKATARTRASEIRRSKTNRQRRAIGVLFSLLALGFAGIACGAASSGEPAALRAMDWVPRSVRARARDIERAIAELERKLHRAPTDEEIAGKLGMTQQELEDSLTDISRSSIAALDELWTVNTGGGGGDQVALIDTIEDTEAPDPQSSLSQTEMKEAV